MTLKHRLESARRLVLMALCVAVAGSAEALSLTVENGEITGILGLEIQGRGYNITFVDGTLNAVYPPPLNGYAALTEDAAQALLAASDSGALQADPNWRKDLRPRGCSSEASCTILIPDESEGAAPNARTTHARELIFSEGRFRSVTPKLWPFDASTDTKYMPDMLYAIIERAR
ncbi:hypothetical protein G3480_17920 [Thiorhodococcus mannitoliphagus]|uniref:DUF2259 domain-containing protein n=1 Tax=Thiorhodococcus mannitoliphagus TaxID=329406 RepID=A0A6P1DVK9_9GAMM|nr:hypothetical protein [Thiorhodococcus mannitoliphagus]NEX22158.1 hypothetical protein [Thiorhodococcus mannitoliphagus]